jgi:eukaryotic-like serine/threonine-protein kinase
LRKLLRRFLDVCNAVDYAHSRGVIHRDLKPANIILGKHGETLVVDWGLAKAVGRADPSVGEQTIAPSSSGSSETLPGSALGTPAYMSPEQAAGDLDRLGPRSDVYSLGATLYCLLTGKPPFDGDDVGETLRKVQLGEFPAPREVNPTLDMALEAICSKAMATKPADRYASCRALAEDLERWAADEAVMAYLEPWTRTLVRWLTQHRTGVTGVAAAVLAGVVGLSVVLVVQTQANAQLSASLKRETKAKLDLAAANANLSEEHAKVEARNRELADERAKVQARYELATDAIKTFHTGVSEDFLLKEEKFKELRNRLLKSASDFYGKLGALLGKETDLASRRALAQANFELSDLTDKVGRKEDALAAHRQVLAARLALAAEPGADVETKVDVGRSLTAVAGLLSAAGKTDEAEATYRKAETLLADLARSSPSTQAARAALANCRTGMGTLRYDTGKFVDALASYRLARDDQEALADAPGASKEARRDLGLTIHRTGLLLWYTGKNSEAEAEDRKAIALRQKLADDYPAVTEFRSDLARSHNNLGILLSDTGRLSEAVAELRKTIALMQKLADENPAVTGFRLLLADFQSSLALMLTEQLGKPSEAVTQQLGKPSEAVTAMEKAIALYQKLADDNPAVIQFRHGLANGHNTLAIALSETGKPTEAEAESRAAIAIMGKVVDDDPKVLKHRVFLAAFLRNLGNRLLKLGRPAEALDAYGQSYTLLEQLVKEDPTEDSNRRRSLVGRGLARRALGDPAGAAADVRHALRLSEGLRLPEGAAAFSIACAHAALAGLAGQEGTGVSAAEGKAHADQAMPLLRKAVDAGFRYISLYRTEGALDPLREREDFKKLLAELEQKSAAKPGKTP